MSRMDRNSAAWVPRANKVSPQTQPGQQGITITRQNDQAEVAADAEQPKTTTQAVPGEAMMATKKSEILSMENSINAAVEFKPGTHKIVKHETKVYSMDLLLSLRKLIEPVFYPGIDKSIYDQKNFDRLGKHTRQKITICNSANDEKIAKIRSILNKMAESTFDSLMKQLIDIELDNEELLKSVVECIFDKVIQEIKFHTLYAHFCQIYNNNVKLTFEVPEENSKQKKGLFINMLLAKCQDEFNATKWDKQRRETRSDDQNETINEEEEEEAYEKYRKKCLGNIKFIGALLQKRLCSKNIVINWLDSLLEGEHAFALEAACRLLHTVGHELEKKHIASLDNFLEKMNKIAASGKISQRVRFMVFDIVELRGNGWATNTTSSLLRTPSISIANSLSPVPSMLTPVRRVRIERKTPGAASPPLHHKPAYEDDDEEWDVVVHSHPKQKSKRLQKSGLVAQPFSSHLHSSIANPIAVAPKSHAKNHFEQLIGDDSEGEEEEETVVVGPVAVKQKAAMLVLEENAATTLLRSPSVNQNRPIAKILSDVSILVEEYINGEDSDTFEAFGEFHVSNHVTVVVGLCECLLGIFDKEKLVKGANLLVSLIHQDVIDSRSVKIGFISFIKKYLVEENDDDDMNYSPQKIIDVMSMLVAACVARNKLPFDFLDMLYDPLISLPKTSPSAQYAPGPMALGMTIVHILHIRELDDVREMNKLSPIPMTRFLPKEENNDEGLYKFLDFYKIADIAPQLKENLDLVNEIQTIISECLQHKPQNSQLQILSEKINELGSKFPASFELPSTSHWIENTMKSILGEQSNFIQNIKDHTSVLHTIFEKHSMLQESCLSYLADTITDSTVLSSLFTCLTSFKSIDEFIFVEWVKDRKDLPENCKSIAAKKPMKKEPKKPIKKTD